MSSISSSDFEEVDDIDLSGIVFNKRYVAIEELGSGVSATVWLVYDTRKNVFRAMKFINHDQYEEAEDEIEIMKEIKPFRYIIELLDHFTYKSDLGKHWCMIFELFACSVDDVINVKEGKYSNGIPKDMAYKFCEQIRQSIMYLHEQHQIMHTDIKPENMLIRGVHPRIQKLMDQFYAKGLNKKWKRMVKSKKKLTIELNQNDSDCLEFILTDAHEVVLGDFGNAIHERDISLDEIQTRHYRAPEVVSGDEYDWSADLWSLRPVYFELCSGKVMFDPVPGFKMSTNRSHVLGISLVCGGAN